jgi:hypothetical protein
MNSVSVPKAFISYSWSNSERVLELAQRLTNDGVEIVLDKWELKDGQDKYAFMERSVSDESIEKVLMICDKSYTEKADKREGGVGDETMVISPEVYEKTSETKFIPVIFEKDENGKPYLPAYLKSRIYIDLTDGEQYEKNYESLLRNLHNKPEHSKPLIGKMPEWLNVENVNLSSIRNIVKQVQTYDGKNQAKVDFVIRKFNDEFSKTLISLAPASGVEFDQNLLKQIDAAKPLRDLYLDYLEAYIMTGLDVATIIGDFFEQVNNNTYNTNGRNSYSNNEFEFYEYILWETFICTIVLLLHYEKYAEIRKVLNRTYFFKKNAINSDVDPQSYVALRKYFYTIEEICKPKCKNPRLYTLSGDILLKRIWEPIINEISIVNADLILCQMSLVLKSELWFPTSYIYYKSNKQHIWSKLVSRVYCNKIFPLFGVSTIEALKSELKKCVWDRDIRHQRAWDSAPTIQNSINLDQIGTLP